MGPSRRGEAGRRLGRRLLLLALVGLGAFQAAGLSAADEPTVEPIETASGYAWKPSAVTAAPGGTVAFRNPGNVVPHGVHWTGGPEKPGCSGVPVDEFGTTWTGTCTFTEAGTYTFVCTVHPEEMKGTITVTSGETPPPTAPVPGQPPSTADGVVVETLQLATRQHGRVVRGAVTVSSTAVGGDLAIELRASATALGGHGNGPVRIGELRRTIGGAGRLPFTLHLRPLAQQALNRRGHLSLLVKTTVRPPEGAPATMTRSVRLSV